MVSFMNQQTSLAGAKVVRPRVENTYTTTPRVYLSLLGCERETTSDAD
jgi:hypothetical protein